MPALLDQLLEAKLVSASAALRLERAKGEALEDALVRAGVVEEMALLRFLAQVHQTRYVSSERLEGVEVPSEALAFLPADVALKLCALPLRFDRARSELLLVMADPARADELDALPRIARIEHLVAYVALPSAILRAVRRCHRLEEARARSSPFKPARRTVARCPGCRAPVAVSQLQCDACGLGLDLDAASDVRREPSLVRALITSSGPRPQPEAPPVPTSRYALALGNEEVLRLRGGAQLLEERLSELEGKLVPFVDGRTAVAEIGRRAGLSSMETRLLLTGLLRRELVEPVPPPAPLPAQRFERTTEPEVPAFVPPARPRPPPDAPDEADRSVERLVQKAFALEGKGDHAATLKKLEQAIGRAKRPAPLFSRLALLVLNQWHAVHEAMRLLERAVALEPENHVLRANLMKVVARAAALTNPRAVLDKGRRGRK